MDENTRIVPPLWENQSIPTIEERVMYNPEINSFLPLPDRQIQANATSMEQTEQSQVQQQNTSAFIPLSQTAYGSMSQFEEPVPRGTPFIGPKGSITREEEKKERDRLRKADRNKRIDDINLTKELIGNAKRSFRELSARITHDNNLKAQGLPGSSPQLMEQLISSLERMQARISAREAELIEKEAQLQKAHPKTFMDKVQTKKAEIKSELHSMANQTISFFNRLGSSFSIGRKKREVKHDIDQNLIFFYVQQYLWITFGEAYEFQIYGIDNEYVNITYSPYN
jgi:hypothetical protein